MKLPRFVYIKPTKLNQEELGAGLILSTKEPYYFGKIIRLKDDNESIRLINNNPLVWSNVLGYSIYIVFGGSLPNVVRVNSTGNIDDLQETFDDMAQWYRQEFINVSPGSFKIFKI